MPHMSPMHWSMMFLLSFTMLMFIYTNMYFSSLYNKESNYKMLNLNYNNHNWKWSQD